MKNLWAAASLAAAVLAGGAGALAAEESKKADLTIALDIQPGCNLNFDGGSQQLSFGAFISLKEKRQASGSFSLKCTQDYDEITGKTVTISLDGGEANPADKPEARFLYSTDRKSKMSFQIYRGSSGTDIWGEGKDAYSVPIPAGAAEAFKIPFYAELFAQNLDNAPAGVYSNTLHATVRYN